MSIALNPVQASAYNTGPRYEKSETELARQVAAHLHWYFHPQEGSIHDDDGRVIAESIEALAEAGQHLEWFLDDGRGIFWGGIRTHSPATTADDVRRTLQKQHQE